MVPARLSAQRLVIIDRRINDFINAHRGGLSLFNLNCQGLESHCPDICDMVLENSKVLIFSEVYQKHRLPNTTDENINIPNFNCVISYRRPNISHGGVAIYHRANDTIYVVGPRISVEASPSQYFGALTSPVGDICLAECKRPHGQTILIVAVYISPNTNILDIIRFLHKSLLPYTSAGALELGNEEDKIPMILSGDFNVRFDCVESQPLTDFLRQKFNLTMNNNPTIPTTKSGTTIDAIFTRYLNNVESQNYISYFSYHKPIITVVPIEPQNPGAQIQEISL